jgi:thiol-disulfide isomerase/thioredoxin
MTRWPALVLLLAVLVSAVGDLRLYFTDWDRWGPLGPEDEIPRFSVPGVDNAGISNQSLDGQVTLLTFWASWCGPCAQEMPAIEAVSQAYADRGVRVVGVNRDREGDVVEIVRTYKAEKGLSFDMVLDPGTIGKAFRVSMIPHLVIVDAASHIRFVHQGRVSESIIRKEVDELLAEASG